MSINSLGNLQRSVEQFRQPDTSGESAVGTGDYIEPASGSVNIGINFTEKDLNIELSERSIIKAVERANKIIINRDTRAEFTIHEKTHDVMIKIIDTNTKEVIREFPPKKIIDLVAKLLELAGIIVDERR